MAVARAFVQMVVNTVCQPPPLNVSETAIPMDQWLATSKEACEDLNRRMRSLDGELLNEVVPDITTPTDLDWFGFWLGQTEPKDFQGRTIKMAVKKMPDPAYLNSTLEPDRWSFTVIDFLADMFNFTIEYVPSQPATGGVLDGGKWNGLTGKLVRQEVHMTASFLAATSGRIDAVTFSETLGHSGIGMLIKKPTVETRDDSLLAPFTSQVWTVILVSMLVMGPLIWGIIRFRVWLAPGDAHLNRIIPLTSCVWFVYGGLMKQGTTLQPTTDSSRLLFATWWIYITVLTAFYTANLTAYMTFSTLKIHIRTLQDLRDSEQSWLAPAGDSIQMYVEGSRILSAMYQQGRGAFVSEFEPPDQIVRKVSSGHYVYIDEVSKLKAMMMTDYYDNNKECSVYVVPLKEQYLRLALAEPRGSQFLEIFNPILKWLVMTGVLPKWQRDAAVDSAPCEVAASIQGTKLRLSELRMVFLVILVAYAASCGMLVLELMLSWLVRWWKRSRGGSGKVEVLSGVRHVVLHARSDARRSDMWAEPVGHGHNDWMPSFGGSQFGNSQFNTRPRGRTPPSWSRGDPSWSGEDPGRSLTPVRTDQEVLRDMRASVKRINGRPYMFVRTSEGLRPVPVTQDKSEVLYNIFQRLKRKPSDDRPDV